MDPSLLLLPCYPSFSTMGSNMRGDHERRQQTQPKPAKSKDWVESHHHQDHDATTTSSPQDGQQQQQQQQKQQQQQERLTLSSLAACSSPVTILEEMSLIAAQVKNQRQSNTNQNQLHNNHAIAAADATTAPALYMSGSCSAGVLNGHISSQKKKKNTMKIRRRRRRNCSHDETEYDENGQLEHLPLSNVLIPAKHIPSRHHLDQDSGCSHRESDYSSRRSIIWKYPLHLQIQTSMSPASTLSTCSLGFSSDDGDRDAQYDLATNREDEESQNYRELEEDEWIEPLDYGEEDKDVESTKYKNKNMDGRQNHPWPPPIIRRTPSTTTITTTKPWKWWRWLPISPGSIASAPTQIQQPEREQEPHQHQQLQCLVDLKWLLHLQREKEPLWPGSRRSLQFLSHNKLRNLCHRRQKSNHRYCNENVKNTAPTRWSQEEEEDEEEMTTRIYPSKRNNAPQHQEEDADHTSTTVDTAEDSVRHIPFSVLMSRFDQESDNDEEDEEEDDGFYRYHRFRRSALVSSDDLLELDDDDDDDDTTSTSSVDPLHEAPFFSYRMVSSSASSSLSPCVQLWPSLKRRLSSYYSLLRHPKRRIRTPSTAAVGPVNRWYVPHGDSVGRQQAGQVGQEQQHNPRIQRSSHQSTNESADMTITNHQHFQSTIVTTDDNAQIQNNKNNNKSSRWQYNDHANPFRMDVWMMVDGPSWLQPFQI